MEVTNSLKHETLEKLATLWVNPDFKELVRILRLTQDKYAQLCLTRNNMDEIRELQYKAAGISVVIKTVEEANKKINNEDKGEK